MASTCFSLRWQRDRARRKFAKSFHGITSPVGENDLAEGERMPMQSVEHSEEKAGKAKEMAAIMSCSHAKRAMLEIADLYRRLATQTAKFLIT